MFNVSIGFCAGYNSIMKYSYRLISCMFGSHAGRIIWRNGRNLHNVMSRLVIVGMPMEVGHQFLFLSLFLLCAIREDSSATRLYDHDTMHDQEPRMTKAENYG